MAHPLEIFNAWQSRQQAGDFSHLGEVVDLTGFRDICIGLSDWTTGYQAAFANLTRNILTPFADLRMTVEDVIEGQDAVVVREQVEATHMGDFLGECMRDRSSKADTATDEERLFSHTTKATQSRLFSNSFRPQGREGYGRRISRMYQLMTDAERQKREVAGLQADECIIEAQPAVPAHDDVEAWAILLGKRDSPGCVQLAMRVEAACQSQILQDSG
jgi:hypothetical protein